MDLVHRPNLAGPGGHSGPQHVARTQLGNAQHFFQFGTVGAFSRTRRSKENHNVAGPVIGEFRFLFLNDFFFRFAEPTVLCGLALVHLSCGQSGPFAIWIMFLRG